MVLIGSQVIHTQKAGDVWASVFAVDATHNYGVVTYEKDKCVKTHTTGRGFHSPMIAWEALRFYIARYIDQKK